MCNLTFVHEPRISQSLFTRILAEHHSPAAAVATELYAVCVTAKIDPAIALAFFAHESTYGTKGVAVRSRNWGNIRKGQGLYTHIPSRIENGFAFYQTWQHGLIDWCSLINRVYVSGRGLTTVGKAIPVYAPSSDHNKPDRYAAAVCELVAQWQACDIPVDHSPD